MLFPAGRELRQPQEDVDAEVLADEALELAAFDDLDAVAVVGGEVAGGLADPGGSLRLVTTTATASRHRQPSAVSRCRGEARLYAVDSH